MVAVCGKKKRQIIFHARRRQSFTDVAIDHRFLRVAFEARAKALTKTLDGLVRQRELACRQQSNLLERSARTLADGVELTDGLDLVAEQIEPVGVGLPVGNRSITPPRTANSPGSMT